MVVGVIAALMAMLLPALSRAKATAHGGACLSTQRQISAAQVMYQDMYDGYLPRQGSPASPGRPEMIPWNIAFRPFLDDRCSPGRDLNDQFGVAPYYQCAARPLSSGSHRVHYVVNGFVFLDDGRPDERGATDPAYLRGPMPARWIKAPSRMLYLMDFAADPGDVLYGRWLGAGTTDIAIGQFYDAWLTRHLTESSDDYRIGPRQHPGGANALFLDGHAERRDAGFFGEAVNWDDGWHNRM